MNLGTEDWGRKIIRITDLNSGHSTGAIFYTTYKGWWSNAGSDNPGGAEMLMFQADKKSYTVGEKVSVELPVTHKGKALVSIETGSRVLKVFWFEPTSSNPRFTFEATPEMAPNASMSPIFSRTTIPKMISPSVCMACRGFRWKTKRHTSIQ